MATAAQAKPLTAHSLFPAVVGLWFGALFGLGSLAMGSDTLERAVLTLQLDTAIVALAPPLGIAARLGLASILAVFGGALGYALGRIVSRRPVFPAHRPQPRPEPQSDQPAGFPATPGVLLGRRRTLTAAETEDDFTPYDAAPLPGGGLPQIFDITALEPAPPEPEPEPELALDQEFDDAAEPGAEPGEPPANAAAVLAGDPAALGTVQLAERLALALQGRRARRVAHEAIGEAGAGLVAPPLPDLHSTFGLPPLSSTDEDDEDEFAEDGVEGDYSSLLDLGAAAPPRRMPAWNEEQPAAPSPSEPVVIFPGQLVRDEASASVIADPAPARDRGETEQALRAALANLQRLSGAA